MKKCRINFSIVFCLALVSAFGQESRLIKAEKAMQFLQYAEAIALYEAYLSKKDDQQVVLALAMAYRKNRAYDRAAATFSRVENWSGISPDYLLQYGRVLIQTSSCAEAQPVFDAYLERRPFDTRAAKFRDVCDAIQKMKQREEGLTELISLGINTAFNEMAPSFYGNSLVFASDRLTGKGAFWDLFIAEDPRSSVSPASFPAPINTKRHEATATFSADSNQIFFTRSSAYATLSDDRRIVPLEILSASRKADGNWSEPASLPLAAPPFSAAHPCLSRDGKRLFFSSDQPGGYGGKDIYFSSWTGTNWGVPVNLGPAINTEGDELFPFFGADNRLYFSSDGHLGLGGLDIFFADVAPDGENIYVENLGVPFNSAENDFALTIAPDGQSGYFSSDRPGGAGGDDIYGFQRLFKLVELEILREDAKTPVSNFTIQCDCEIRNGNLLRLPLQSCCFLEISAPGLTSRFVQICGTDPLIHSGKSYPIFLESEKKTTLQGIVADEVSGMPLPGVSIHIFENNARFLTLISSPEGLFSAELPPNRCFSLRIEKGDYFTRMLDKPLCTINDRDILKINLALQPFRVITPTSVNNPVNPAGSTQAANEELTFTLQIYYDQFSAEIREDAVPELERLWGILKDNPALKVEISAHTDTRGDRESNLRLSQKRADSVVKWLIQKGIPRRQLIPMGYGESQPIKPCPTSRSCLEEDHQLNRRTEFRVIGTIDQ
jgi:outer membrane protein OmpA-like peptidoglycan-associated protein